MKQETTQGETEQPKEEKGELIHHGYSCDGCYMKPVIGLRYRSLVKRNFDYCEACFQKSNEPIENFDIKCEAEPKKHCRWGGMGGFHHGPGFLKKAIEKLS